MSIDETLAERGKRYGDFATQATTSQTLKDTMRDAPKWQHLTDAQKESLEMISSKISRILHGDPHYDDSWRDISGYAKLVENTLTP